MDAQGTSRAAPCHGITLVEVLLVLGVITTLIGILLPAVSGAIDRARLARALMHIKENTVQIFAYSTDYQGTFPLAVESSCGSAVRWDEAIVRWGGFQSTFESDPEGYKLYGMNRYWMSVCMTRDADRMIWGRVRACEYEPATPVRVDQVTYPSLKGVMLRQGRVPRSEGGTWFCCGDPVVEPVSMTDGSAMLASRLDFLGGVAPVLEQNVGYPVYSTWGGFEARDR